MRNRDSREPIAEFVIDGKRLSQFHARWLNTRKMSHMRLKRLCLVTTLSLILLSALPSKGASGFAVGVHESLTAEALSFLNPAILDDINGEHEYQDYIHFGDSSRHFDNCRFAESINYINQQYTRPNGTLGDGGVLAELDPSDPQPYDATDEFGQLLHPAEDFYAHSNWVEMGRTDLLDSGLELRPPLNAWAVLRDNVIVAQGESLPSGWTVDAGPNPKAPLITTDSGQQGVALISGTFLLSDDCYDPIALPHGSDDADALNKDNSSRPGFAEARALAVRQAQHEWCRMLNLLKNEYGLAGASVPMALWVDPAKQPHPQGTPCAQPTPAGETNVTVKISRMVVIDDTDPFADGEINLVLVVYTADFRNSVRLHVGPMDIGSGEALGADVRDKMTLTLPCLASNDTAVTTLQGWDDDNGNDGIYDDADLDPDDVLTGLTVLTDASELGGRQVNVSSQHLDATFDIETSVSPDADGDGLTGCREQLLGTDPANADTDQDGVSDGDEVNIYGTNPLQPDPFADVGITKTLTPNPVIAGSSLQYVLAVTNAGPASATNVEVADPLPTGISAIAVTPAENCTQQQGALACTFAALASGETKNVVVDAQVDPTLADGAMIANTATVTSAGMDVNLGNNTSVVAAPVVRRVDLALQQTDSPDPVAAGALLTYTFAVANQGLSAASNTTLSTTLPPGFTYRSSKSYPACTENQGNVLCELGAMLPSTQLTVPIVVTVDPLIEVRTVVQSAASIVADEQDTTPENNHTQIETVVTRSTGLAVTHVSSTSLMFAGRQIVYEIRATNLGDSIATGVVLTDTLPDGVLFDPEASSLGCTAAGQQAACELGTLPDGSSRTTMIAGQVSPMLTPGTTLTNQIGIYSDEVDPDLSDNIDQEITVVGSQLFLSHVLNQPPLNLPGDVDLIVKAITVDADGPQVTIQNIGKGAILPGNNFWVDLYFGSPVTPTMVNQTWQGLQAEGGAVWGVMGAGTRLGPGDELTLRLGDAFYSPSNSKIPDVIGAGTVYAQVDSANIATYYGGVLETHELRGEEYKNNIASIELFGAISTDRWNTARVSAEVSGSKNHPELPMR